MADKKFGQKRVCENCEAKFYDLNKKSPIKCPMCEHEIVVLEDTALYQTSQNSQRSNVKTKDDLVDLDNQENNVEEGSSDDEIISLDDAVLEEEEVNNSKN